MSPEQERTLIAALDALEAGQSIDAILEGHPKDAEALRPALTLARALDDWDVAPSPVAAATARRNYLSAAGGGAAADGSETPVRSGRWLALGRWATGLAALALMLVVFGFGSSAAASQALPGDALYPVKRGLERARLAVATSDEARQREIDRMAEARLDEVRRLLEAPDRQVETVFSGPVEAFGDEQWTIAGVELHLQPATRIVGMAEIGEWVHVRGRIENGRFVADTILYDSRVPFEPSIDPWPDPDTFPTEDPDHAGAHAPTATPPSAPHDGDAALEGAEHPDENAGVTTPAGDDREGLERSNDDADTHTGSRDEGDDTSLGSRDERDDPSSAGLDEGEDASPGDAEDGDDEGAGSRDDDEDEGSSNPDDDADESAGKPDDDDDERSEPPDDDDDDDA